jgi:hypothetical protein
MSPGILAWWAACERQEPARPRPEPPDDPPAPVYTTPPAPLVGSCEDLASPNFPDRPPRNAHRASDVRTAWIKGAEGRELGWLLELRQGQLLAHIEAPVREALGHAIFTPPLRPSMTVDDDAGRVQPGDPYGYDPRLRMLDLTDGPGEELLIPSDQGEVVEGPLPLGVSVLEDLSEGRGMVIDTYFANTRSTMGDWDGDGILDLGLAWSGHVLDGERQWPDESFPVGGLAVYRGPVDPGARFLTEQEAPAATYDPTAPDLYPEGGFHSGRIGVLIDDQDGDGKADVVVDGYDWEARVPGDPLSSGGIAYFSSGPRRRSELEHAELQLYGLCGSVLMDLQEVGDVTGDGLDDVVIISNGAMDRGVVFVAPHLGDLTGHHSLATASRAIIVHDRSTANGSAFEHFTDARGMPDLDGNGVDELVLTDVFDGAAYVFLGPVTGLLNIGDADLTLEDGGQGFASTVAVGDLDGDALPDLAVGDPTYADVFPEFLGAISVFPGTALLAALEPR